MKPPGGTGAVRAVGFSPDGSQVAYSLVDGLAVGGGNLPVMGAAGGITLDPQRGVFAWGTDDQQVAWAQFPYGLAPPNAPPTSLWSGALQTALLRDRSQPGFPPELVFIVAGAGQLALPGMRGPGGFGPGGLEPPPTSGSVGTSAERTIQTFRIEPFAPPMPAVIGEHDAAVVALVLSADDRWLASASSDGVLRVWELGQQPAHVSLESGGRPRSLALTAGHDLVVLLEDGTLRAWQLQVP